MDYGLIRTEQERQAGPSDTGSSQLVEIKVPATPSRAGLKATVLKAPTPANQSAVQPTSQTRDLRRNRRVAMERLLGRVEYLPGAERALIEAVFRNDTPVVRVAALSGRTGQVRQLRRQVRAIVTRALSDRFGSMARQIRVGTHRWPPLRRRIGELLYLEGKTLRTAASELGITVHVVRAHRAALEAIFEAGAR